ncbi:MAG: diguanylate cyclase, partial [Lentisphaerota bacterium]
LLRRDDLAATLGGDDFLVMAMASPGEAEAMAARILESARNMTIEFGGARLRWTLSAGVAGFPSNGRSPGELYEAAEAAMRAAVKAGRNRCVLAGGEARSAGKVSSASGF